MAQRKNTTPKGTKKKATGTLVNQIIQKQASQTAKDMADWRRAKNEATKPDFPKRQRLVDLITDLLHDTHLSAQMDLRIERSLERDFVIRKADGDPDEETTKLLRESNAWGDLIELLLSTPFWGHSLIELLPDGEQDLFSVALLPRRHVVPGLGILLREVSDIDGIRYRELSEYGTSVVEVGNPDDLGILFDCAPDTIYRRHAKSAWSVFCELYGVPPRILKMDTMDTEAFSRSVQMMQRMGSANWTIIDSSEEMQFAQGVSDNGNIFQNLITATEQSISIKICGAIIGQDTLHGNRSKEETSMRLLDSKCASDRRMVERQVNGVILPALIRMGLLSDGLSFSYLQEDNTQELFERTTRLLSHYEVDEDWLKNTFGIEIIGRRESAMLAPQLNAQLRSDTASAESIPHADSDFFG